MIARQDRTLQALACSIADSVDAIGAVRTGQLLGTVALDLIVGTRSGEPEHSSGPESDLGESRRPHRHPVSLRGSHGHSRARRRAHP